MYLDKGSSPQDMKKYIIFSPTYLKTKYLNSIKKNEKKMMLHHEKLEIYNLLLFQWKAELFGHNFENTPLQLSLDVSCKISLYLAKRFQRGRFLYTFQISNIRNFGIWVPFRPLFKIIAKKNVFVHQ